MFLREEGVDRGVEGQVGEAVPMKGCLGLYVSIGVGLTDDSVKGDKVENSHPAPDPSEAPSSPTIAETPVKSKTYPQPGHMDDHDEGLISQKHVAFAPVATADPILAKPIPTKLTVPEPRFGDTISSSPDTSLRVPTPVPPPTSPASTTIHQPTKTAAGEAIPPSAMTQAELHQAGLDQHAGLTVEDRVPVDEEDRATIDDRAEGDLGATESVVPEGMGSKRLYKMSKMFSESPIPARVLHCQSSIRLIILDAAGVLSEAWATVEDSDELDTFQPHVIHKPHNPVPVAMCCRKPHGCEYCPSLVWIEANRQSRVIMTFGIRRTPLGSLGLGMPRRRCLCEYNSLGTLHHPTGVRQTINDPR